MDILDKFNTQGSNFTNSGVSAVDGLVLGTSRLHASIDGQAGYSLNGSFLNEVKPEYLSYDIGSNTPNHIPLPTQLGMGGTHGETYLETNPQ